MTSNYHNVKRRYFANLGISPPASTSYPPSPFQSSPSPPATPFSSFQPIPQTIPSPAASPRADLSSDSDLDLSVEESSSFDMDMESIFEMEHSVPPPSPPHPDTSKCLSGGHRSIKSQSIPQSIPGSSSPVDSSPQWEPATVTSPGEHGFIPPHLLTSRSGFSFFEYERTRRAAKKAF